MYQIRMKYFIFLLFALRLSAADQRPNIVWIFTEDMNDWMGCYGDSTVPTPNIVQLLSCPAGVAGIEAGL